MTARSLTTLQARIDALDADLATRDRVLRERVAGLRSRTRSGLATAASLGSLVSVSALLLRRRARRRAAAAAEPRGRLPALLDVLLPMVTPAIGHGAAALLAALAAAPSPPARGPDATPPPPPRSAADR